MSPINLKIIISLLLSGWLLSPAATVVAEMLTGTVQSIDERNSQLVLIPVSPDQAAETKDELPGSVVVGLGDDYITRCESGRNFPGCVEPGKTIRVWGTFSGRDGKMANQDQKLFIATDIRGSGGRFLRDSSGVRSRIGRACKFRLFGKGRNGGGDQ